MKDDTRGIDDASQRVALVLLDLSGNREREFSKAVVQAGERVFSLGYLLPDANKHGSRGTNHSAVRFDLNDCGETGTEQEIVERGQKSVQTVQAGIGGGVLAALHRLVEVYPLLLPQENSRHTLPHFIGTTDRANPGCVQARTAERGDNRVCMIRGN